MKNLIALLPSRVMAQLTDISNIIEIRLRRDMPIKVSYRGGSKTLSMLVSSADIDYILTQATQSSIYAYQDKLREGFLPYDGGIRIGIAGEGVLDGGKLAGIKNITSLAVRLPHEVKGCADKLKHLLPNFRSMLLISPPGAGKTTLMRELARLLSRLNYNVLVIDERGEIAATRDGIAMLDLGTSCDIVSYLPKLAAYESAVRTMSPDIIVTDEIFGAAEVDAILDCMRSGVQVLATLHGSDIDSALRLPIYADFRNYFATIVVLSKEPVVGTIKEVVELCSD